MYLSLSLVKNPAFVLDNKRGQAGGVGELGEGVLLAKLAGCSAQRLLKDVKHIRRMWFRTNEKQTG